MKALLLLALAAAPASAELLSTAAVDALYFSRDKPGALEKTIEGLQLRLKENPREFDSLWRLGRSFVETGARREKKGEKIEFFSRAERTVESALAVRDDDARAHYWYGIAMGRLGQTRGIMRSLFMIGPMKKRMRRVLELDARHSGAYHVLGEMHRELPGFAGGSTRLAIEYLEKAVEYGPTHTSHYTALAEAYLDAGREEEAVRILKAIEFVKVPADPPAVAGHRAHARSLLEKIKQPR